MKTVYIAPHADAEMLAAMFRTELPGYDIVTARPVGRPAAYVVVGKPERGFFAGLAGIELVLSLNAGIEALLASTDIPVDVPIVRMVDPGLVEGMVEWVAAQLLAWHRNLFVYRRQQGDRDWRQHPELMARERRVTVLGAGALGEPVAAMLATLGFQVRTWSRSGRQVPGTESFSGEQLVAAVTGADALINILPATAATADLIDTALLDRLAPGAVLINAGRGATVVDDAVLSALDAGQLGWAVLDVFRVEPLPVEHRYWTHPKVFVSPHVAAPTHARTAVAVMAENIRRHQRGEPVAPLVDRARGY